MCAHRNKTVLFNLQFSLSLSLSPSSEGSARVANQGSLAHDLLCPLDLAGVFFIQREWGPKCGHLGDEEPDVAETFLR